MGKYSWCGGEERGGGRGSVMTLRAVEHGGEHAGTLERIARAA